jgi:integrase
VVQVPDLQGTLIFAHGSWYRMVDQKYSYLTQKNGIYYYTRRVPRSLSSRFGKERFVKCLHTSSRSKAERISSELSSRLENIWDRLRLDLVDFAPVQTSRNKVKSNADHHSPKLSEVVEVYLRLKKQARGYTFVTSTKRNIRYLIECVGDIPIAELHANQGSQFRDHLTSKGLTTASVKRVFASVKAVVNLGITEFGLEVQNVFASVYLPDGRPSKPRMPIPDAGVSSIQIKCMKIDDEMRWLIALLSDTGMRLSEACGLTREDIIVSGELPHLLVRPREWRRLKTATSERVIPLVGSALWAAGRAYECSDNVFLFPKYCSYDGVKANSASGALNKWLKGKVPAGCVIHSFRHSFRDRLRAMHPTPLAYPDQALGLYP